MAPLQHLLYSLVALIGTIPATSALFEQVLSTVIYTNHGERTPRSLGHEVLTALGAQQAYRAGDNMRQRYLTPATTNATSYTIREISSKQLNNEQITILTDINEWNSATAQAFMQGLFPPLGSSYQIAGQDDLANGSFVEAPLNYYQYPNLGSASSTDLRSIFVKGSKLCPSYDLLELQYYNSSRYGLIHDQAQPFYDSLRAQFFRGMLDDDSIGYFNAYYIWDYLSYASIHNQTVARLLSPVDLAKAKLYAENWMFDMYANTTSEDKVNPAHIYAIAGRTLATYVMEAFNMSIESGGLYDKMNLMFGDYKPIMSFAALAQLITAKTGIFTIAPPPGASMMFELYTLQPARSAINYPPTSNMYVRFFYQNGTDADFVPLQKSLFGMSPSVPLPYADFVNEMSSIAIGIEDWCNSCSSPAIFCPFFEPSNTSGSSSSNFHQGLNPAVAGVIGAIVTLAFFALLVAGVMLLGGIRFHRRPNGRRSEAGGYKGSEKLASDQDLTIPKGGAGATVIEEPRGHERVGSWELKEPIKTMPLGVERNTGAFGRVNLNAEQEDNIDHYTIPVKPRDTV